MIQLTQMETSQVFKQPLDTFTKCLPLNRTQDKTSNHAVKHFATVVNVSTNYERCFCFIVNKVNIALTYSQATYLLNIMSLKWQFLRQKT